MSAIRLQPPPSAQGRESVVQLDGVMAIWTSSRAYSIRPINLATPPMKPQPDTQGFALALVGLLPIS